MNEVKLLSPIERPIHDILCVGVNYQAHLEEASERAKISRKQVMMQFILASVRLK